MDTNVYDTGVADAARSRQNKNTARRDQDDRKDESPNVVRLEDSGRSRQWTIKGLSQDTVEVTREAARQSGMKLNSWISGTLEKAARAELDFPSTANPEPEFARRMQDLEVYIRDELARLREQSRELEHSINSMSTILVKILSKTEILS